MESDPSYGYGDSFGRSGASAVYDPMSDPGVVMLLSPSRLVRKSRTGESATDDVTMRTNPVGTWGSQKSLGYGTAASDGSRPTWHPFGIKSMEGVLFNGTDQRLSFLTDFAGMFRNRNYVYVFVNVKPTRESVAGTMLYAGTNSANTPRFGITFNSSGTAGRINLSARRLDADSATSANIDSAYTSGQSITLGVELGYADGDLNAWIDGEQVLNSSLTGTPGASSNTASASMWIGGNNGGTSWYDGLIGHVLVIASDVKLSPTEVMERQRWMMSKIDAVNIEPPAGLGFTPAIEVWKRGNRYRTTFDLASHDVARAATYYVEPDTGLDANDGLTTGTPLKTIAAAITKVNLQASGEIILMKSGTGYVGGWGAVDINVPVTIRSLTGKAIVSQGYGGSGFASQDQDGVWYRSSAHTATFVYDFSNKDEYGSPQVLESLSTLGEIRKKPGSFGVIGGLTYMHLHDGRQPDDDVCSVTSTANLRLRLFGATAYLENVITVGSSASLIRCVHSGSTTLAMRGCEVHHTQLESGDAVQIDVDGEVYVVDSLVTMGGSDNVDYRPGTTNDLKVYEINSRSHSAGRGSSTLANCTTAHEGTKIVRVGGVYRNAKNRTVHDVNDDTESWNVGCTSEVGRDNDSLPAGAWTVGTEDAGAPVMYLDDCYAFGSGDHFQVFGDNSSMNYTNMELTGMLSGENKMTPY